MATASAKKSQAGAVHLGERLPLVPASSHGDDDSDLLDGVSDGNAASVLRISREIEALGVTRFHWIAVFVCGLANASDAVELLCISFITPELPNVDNTSTATLAASVFIGMLFGGLIVGVASDVLGRKRLLMLSLAINAVFGAISAAAPNWTLLALCRVVAGFGVGASIPGVFSLMTELLPAARRGFFISIVAWHWMIGTIYAAGLAWLMIGIAHLPWQAFAVACALPAATASILLGLLVPESPRYLAAKGYARDAEASVSWMCTMSGVRYASVSLAGSDAADAGVPPLAGVPTAVVILPAVSPISLHVPSETDSLVKHERRSPTSASAGAATQVTAAVPARAGCCSSGCTWLRVPPTVAQLFGSGMRRDTILLCGVWFCLSFGWYGLVLWIPTLFQSVNFDLSPYQDSFLVAAANLPGNLAATLLMDRVPRAWLLSGSLALSCACAIIFGFSTNEIMIVTAACMMNAVSVGAWNSLDVLSVERFPTRLRTSAMGVLSACGRLGSMAGQYVFGALVDISIPATLGAGATVLFIGSVCALLLPRTPTSDVIGFVGGGKDVVPSGGGAAAAHPAVHVIALEDEKVVQGDGGAAGGQ